MKIVIDEVDASRPKAIGFSEMNSYPVHFKCEAFEGRARFVSADENIAAYLNQEVDVGIGHESIGNLRVSEELVHQIIQLTEEFSYHVRGVVVDITYPTEPKGNRITFVVAKDIEFALSFDDIGNLRPDKGETIEFDVHGLSLWDDAL